MEKLLGFISRLTLILLLLVLLSPLAVVHALPGGPAGQELPRLDEFIRQVSNGQAAELRGIYIPGILAARIVQQPPGDGKFVSPHNHVLTQFSAARRLGSIGLLAHNDLEGENFPQLSLGRGIHLVYGDGRVEVYLVSALLEFKTLDPYSASSAFIDLANGATLSASDLFMRAYGSPGRLVFQTCIEQDRLLNWGRLFVIAEPFDVTE